MKEDKTTNIKGTVKFQEIEEPKIAEKPILTLKEKIDRVVDLYYKDEVELKKQIFQLVQRVLYPEQFCPDCEERMFFNPDNSSYNCPNCGYQSRVNAPGTVARLAVPTNRQPGTVPPQVEKVIAEANESMKDTPILLKPKPIGEQIRKLVNDRDSGGSSTPTKEAEAQLRTDKNVAKDVNWI
jgi:tRNA(Ile2) C34 agmatinyltransferase TiaS